MTTSMKVFLAFCFVIVIVSGLAIVSQLKPTPTDQQKSKDLRPEATPEQAAQMIKMSDAPCENQG
jgi:hypothetical protein